jgi:protein-disulfide isomerase
MAFGLGSIWGKVRNTGSAGSGGETVNAPSGAGNQAPAGKYKTVSEALKAYAKEVGLDGNKLWQCVDSDQKADAVGADYDQGGTLGVRGTPGFFVNGKFLGGAFPLPAFKEIIDRELDGTGSNDYTQYKDTNLQGAGAGTQPAFIAKPVNVEIGESAVKGGANAKVTIVEYSDFQCPYCTQAYNTMNQIFTAYGDKVKLVYKHFPLSQIHPLAQKMAEAFECARDQDQNKAWDLHDLLFESQSEWTNATL